MNTDAVLRCFVEGASLDTLAQAFEVPRPDLEQMLREALTRPSPASARPPVSSPRPHQRTGPAVAERATCPTGKARRRTRAEVEQLVLETLRGGPLTKRGLLEATQTSSGVLMQKILAALVARRRVTRHPDRTFHLVGTTSAA